MAEKILFVDGERIGVIDGSATSWHASEQLARYRQNIRSIKERKAWKNEGASAAFRGELEQQQGELDDGSLVAAINGICPLEDGGRVVYSMSSSDYSGVYVKRLGEGAEAEGHVLHNARLVFNSLDYNPRRGELAVAVKSGDNEQHIALLGLDTGSVRTLTEGECLDGNPCWGVTDQDRIYYDSYGIGKDYAGNITGLGLASIYCLDLGRREAAEVLSCAGHDCVLPREDTQGRLYFIKRPHVSRRGGRMSFIDVISVPYKLLKGIFKFLEFFTMSFTGEAFNSRGTNPAKARRQDRKEVFINGNLVNAEKTLKDNARRGEKFPGVAPASWQLMRRDADGTMTVVKKGVLDYDIAGDGCVVYSNGKYIVRLHSDGSEEQVGRHDLVSRLRVCR